MVALRPLDRKRSARRRAGGAAPSALPPFFDVGKFTVFTRTEVRPPPRCPSAAARRASHGPLSYLRTSPLDATALPPVPARPGSAAAQPPAAHLRDRRDSGSDVRSGLLEMLNRVWALVQQRILDGRPFAEPEVELMRKISGATDVQARPRTPPLPAASGLELRRRSYPDGSPTPLSPLSPTRRRTSLGDHPAELFASRRRTSLGGGDSPLADISRRRSSGGSTGAPAAHAAANAAPAQRHCTPGPWTLGTATAVRHLSSTPAEQDEERSGIAPERTPSGRSPTFYRQRLRGQGSLGRGTEPREAGGEASPEDDPFRKGSLQSLQQHASGRGNSWFGAGSTEKSPRRGSFSNMLRLDAPVAITSPDDSQLDPGAAIKTPLSVELEQDHGAELMEVVSVTLPDKDPHGSPFSQAQMLQKVGGGLGSMYGAPRSPTGASRTKAAVLQAGKGALRRGAQLDNLLQLLIDWAAIPVNEIEAHQGKITASMSRLLSAEDCRFWYLDKSLQVLVCKEPKETHMLGVDTDIDAAPSIAVRTGRVLSFGAHPHPRRGLDYDTQCREEGDSTVTSLLVAPIYQGAQIIGVAEARNKLVRGFDGKATILPGFDEDDIKLFEAMVMFVALLHKNNVLFAAAKHQLLRAEAMLEMAGELSTAHLDAARLIPKIMSSARRLTNSDRCSLFVVDEQRKELVAHISGNKRIRVPLDRGIAGHVATTGDALNIQDAYAFPMFNQEVDKATGYRTQSMLCIPVKYEGSVVAVAQLINKSRPDGRVVSYSEEDEEIFDSFAAFVGVSLRNCRAHELLLLSSERNKVMLEAVEAMGKSFGRSPNEVIHTVITGARQLARADRCSVFLFDKERDELYSVTSDSGDTIRIRSGVGIAGQVCKSGKAENIPDAYADPRFNPDVDLKMGYITRSILCVPVIATVDGQPEVVAVSQLINKIDRLTGETIAFTADDEASMHDFARLAGAGIMNSKMYEVAVESHQSAMQLFSATMSPAKSRTRSNSASDCPQPRSFTRPAPAIVRRVCGMRLDAESLAAVTSPAFDIHQYKNDPAKSDLCIVLVIALFEDMGFLEEFSLPRETLVQFLIVVRSKYRSVPYHNFFHAVDVCQTMYCFLKHGGLREMLGSFYSFVMLVTALVHDIDHMGLNNSFHLKSETPMGMLSSSTGSTSILEVHHCNLAIEILSYPEYDVFCGLEDSKPAYRALIDSVLATDMTHHKELMSYAASLFENGFVAGDPDHVKTLMQISLKSADISNITKPFDISRLWAIAVTEEFYQQGDKEKELGQQVLPMFDREASQALANGQIGFIKFVGVPHFEAVQKVIPGLQWWLDNLKSNLAEWQEQLDAMQRERRKTQQLTEG
eukprot:TRINITY_DN917_c0_g6_i1.p1 TRINITY_DN917_c0_g6~~TRINITY_DN917_c0_g6_i1.p1  ORF type:complete len:1378 (+),score=480.69 TRINITY_DN917_c0_g6_i1:68-4135(+)